MRKSPSDEWRWSPSLGFWRYCRWLSSTMGAVGIFMAVVAVFIFGSLASTSDLDRAGMIFAVLFIGGSLSVSAGAFRVYRWLGRRGPQGDGRTPE